jgi:DNA-directed RNA polymerase specialized sigma24 family protein
MQDNATTIRPQLEQLLSDRHSPEARTLYLTLARYIDKRVGRTLYRRYHDVLARPDREELVGDVLLQLMSGSLTRFRGHTIGELLAYVRSICDRTVGHAARRRIRERDTLAGAANGAVRDWTPASPRPDQVVRLVPESPLTEADTTYLEALLHAGSQAELARSEGVSRAAVTQRLHRIRDRIEAMAPDVQDTAKEWVRETARRTEAQRDEAFVSAS